jgi:LmbE family N-acetylglucosaminyl deacetylase
MKLASEGHVTALLTLTRGDKGRWFGKELGSWAQQDLAAERTREWQAATRVIGFAHTRLLEWPDGGLAASPADRVTADVVEWIRELRPDIVCTFGPEGAGSEHDDHRAASFFAVRGFHRAAIATEFAERGAAHQAARLYFNASPFSPDVPFVAMTPTHTVDIKPWEDRKALAFECHKTQFKDRDRFYEMLKRREGREFFHLAIDRRATVPIPTDDVFS